MAADPLVIAVRFGLYAVLGLLFGLPLFTRRHWPAGGWPGRVLLAGGAAAGLALSLLGIAAMAAAMSGVRLDTVDRAALAAAATMPGTGTAFLVRAAALTALLILAISWREPARHRAVVLLLGGIALASLAWNGHAGMADGALGRIHRAADIAHLLAAGAWLGTLAGLLLMLRPSARANAADLHGALAGFAATGTLIVALLVATGAVNVWTIVGIDAITGLPDTAYGQLLLAKLALFVLMLGLAAAHRFRLTPALGASLGQPAAATAALRRSTAVEAAAATAVLGLVAWLGLLSPDG